MRSPLAGLRILDLTRLLPGPYLSLVLADLGADVIKIEAPQGGDWVRWLPPMKQEMSIQFAALNRGKRSVALDLKRPDGPAVLRRLAQGADVLLESFRPGVMDRLGVGWNTLHADNPALVYAALSGYGQTGPWAHKAGHDLNYVALSGVLAMTGAQGGAPQLPGAQLADLAGGALFGAVGILSAIHAREKSGAGAFLDISLTEGALAMNALTLPRALAASPCPRRGVDILNGGVACYQVYRTQDGRFLSLAALEPKFWERFCEAAERPEWRVMHMGQDAALRSVLTVYFEGASLQHHLETFGNADCCVEPVLELDELHKHPQHQARGVFFDLPLPGADAPLPSVRTPLVSAAVAAQATPPPGLGQDTSCVLTEAGFSSEKIGALLSSGTVVQL